jgi:hypothetical protein
LRCKNQLLNCRILESESSVYRRLRPAAIAFGFQAPGMALITKPLGIEYWAVLIREIKEWA